MAFVSSYSFDNMSRIGSDNTYQDQRSLQNTKQGNYTLSNYFAKDCLMDEPVRFATSQPNVFYSGGHGAIGGCNIDENSSLSIGSIQTHPRSRISLHERPFVTMPYMGRGLGDAVLEARIQQGDAVSNRKSITTLSEQSYQPYHHYPLIASLQSDVTNPHRLVEESASKGWIRGGIPSRELSRDNNK